MSWPDDKNPADFLAIADQLRAEGQTSRSDAIIHLVGRLQAYERFVGDLAGEIAKEPQGLIDGEVPRYPLSLAGIYARSRDVAAYWHPEADNRADSEWARGYARGSAVAYDTIRNLIRELEES